MIEPQPATAADTAPAQQLLDARYAVGEDVGPLVRAVLGGLAGGGLALAVDWAIPDRGLAMLVSTGTAAPSTSGLPGQLLWAALWSDAVLGDAAQTAGGVSIGITVAVLASLIFVYGQFRRFIPGPPVVRGLAWALACGVLAGPALVPRAARWLAIGTAPGADASHLVGTAAAVWLEVALGLAIYGVVVGLASPGGRSDEASGAPASGRDHGGV